MSTLKINDRRTSSLLAWLCALTYLGSYMTRVNFAAVTVDIMNDMSWEKSAISAVTTALFISYGAGQLVSGKLCDKFKPHHIASLGLLSSVILNFLIPFCTAIPQMTAIWFINGLAQAMMWPPIVKIMATYLHTDDYQRASVIVSWGGMGGTVAVYLISSVCITLSGWRTVFYICAGITLAVWVLWSIAYPRLISRAEQSEAQHLPAGATETHSATSVLPMPRALYFVLISILLISVVQGALRDSITTWLPNYIVETFDMGDSIAVLSGVIIPIVNMEIYPIVLKIYRRFFTNELTCAATIFVLSTALAVLLYFTYSSVAIVGVLLLALICATMHAINFLIIALVPKRFSRFGNVGTISGLLNSFVYVGSSISIWGIARIAEAWGWQTTIAVWGIAAAVGIGLCLSIARKWSNVYKK